MLIARGVPSVAQFSSQAVIGAGGRKSLRPRFCSVVNLISFTLLEWAVTTFCNEQHQVNKQHQVSLGSGLEGMTAWSFSSRICYPPLQGNPQGKLGNQPGHLIKMDTKHCAHMAPKHRDCFVP